MDDVTGTLLTINKDPNDFPYTSSTVTAYLNIQFMNPVQTPQTVLVIARSRQLKGRKFFMDSEIRNGDGTVLAKSDSLWIQVQRPKEKL